MQYTRDYFDATWVFNTRDRQNKTVLFLTQVNKLQVSNCELASFGKGRTKKVKAYLKAYDENYNRLLEALNRHGILDEVIAAVEGERTRKLSGSYRIEKEVYYGLFVNDVQALSSTDTGKLEQLKSFYERHGARNIYIAPTKYRFVKAPCKESPSVQRRDSGVRMGEVIPGLKVKANYTGQ